MQWGLVNMRFGLGLLIGFLALPAFASEEARRLTEQLRQQDRYAAVYSREQWEQIHDPASGNVSSHFQAETLNGTIRITSFDPSTTCQDVGTAVESLTNLGAKSLRLDLRGNPGGQRMMAICVAGLFVGRHSRVLGMRNVPSPIANLRDLVIEPYDITDPEIMWFPSRTEQITQLPIQVEIDRETASAAEVVAGVIQDFGRGEILGEPSYGKGTAQDCTEMRTRPDLVLCYTIQTFILPSGRSPEGIGILPNALNISRLVKP